MIPITSDFLILTHPRISSIVQSRQLLIIRRMVARLVRPRTTNSRCHSFFPTNETGYLVHDMEKHSSATPSSNPRQMLQSASLPPLPRADRLRQSQSRGLACTFQSAHQRTQRSSLAASILKSNQANRHCHHRKVSILVLEVCL